MKQITPEIKAKIFALYIGHDLCVPNKPKETFWPFDQNEGALKLCGVVGNRIVVYRIAEQKYDMFNQTAIHLRAISSITDEDAVEAAKHYHGVGADLPPERIRHVVRFINHICRCSRDAADYLRSKGYALPAFGYSVDELVGAGVFKIKEVNND